MPSGHKAYPMAIGRVLWRKTIRPWDMSCGHMTWLIAILHAIHGGAAVLTGARRLNCGMGTVALTEMGAPDAILRGW